MPINSKNAAITDTYFIVPSPLLLSFYVFSRFFVERLTIQHIPLRTPLNDPTRVGTQLGSDLPIDFFFLQQFAREHSLDVFQHPSIVALDLHQRAFLHRLQNDMRQMADLIFAQHAVLVACTSSLATRDTLSQSHLIR